MVSEALKSLYGTSRKNDIDMQSPGREHIKSSMPSFTEITQYIYIESQQRIKNKTSKFNVGNRVLPFNSQIYVEILTYLRLCMLQTLDVPLTRDILKHPTEVTPLIRKYLREMYDPNSTIDTNPLLQYVSLIKQLLLAQPSKILVFLFTAIKLINCNIF